MDRLVEGLFGVGDNEDTQDSEEEKAAGQLLCDDMGKPFMPETALMSERVEKEYMLLFKREYLLTATTL